MVRTLVIDLENEYLSTQKEYVNILKNKYNILFESDIDCAKIIDEKSVVITDNKAATDKWGKYAVIGVEHRENIKGVPYVTESVENVDDGYIEMVYARKHKIPLNIIETKNIIIREISLKDVESVCNLYEDKENVRFLPKVSDIRDEQLKAKAYIDNMYGLYGYGMWVIVHKSTGKIIGRAGIEHREVDGKVYRELGYFLERTYQGKGYAYEAATEIMKWAVDNYIEEMVVYVNEKNTPSVKLATKLGFDLMQKKTDGAEKYMLLYKKLV